MKSSMELEGVKMCDLLKAVNRYLVREFDEDAALKRIPEAGIFIHHLRVW